MKIVRIVNAIWLVIIPLYVVFFTDGPLTPKLYLAFVALIAAGLLWETRHETKTPWD